MAELDDLTLATIKADMCVLFRQFILASPTRPDHYWLIYVNSTLLKYLHLFSVGMGIPNICADVLFVAWLTSLSSSCAVLRPCHYIQ